METSNIRFRGVMPALVTPFDANTGNVMEASVRGLMDWHMRAGMTGFYTCGTTGEGPSLQVRTRKQMAEIAVEQARGKAVVINHIGASNMMDALELTHHSNSIGVDAISSLAPTYSFKYTDDELFEYYRVIASETDLPVLVYATAAINVANFPRLMARLMGIPNIIGVKFTIRDYFEMGKTKEVNNGNINIINGPDETLLCGLAMGADGGIGTTYNLMPEWFVALYNAFIAKDLETARTYQYRINRVIEALIKHSANGAIKATKAALALKGFDCGQAVFPAKTYSQTDMSTLKVELEKLGIEF